MISEYIIQVFVIISLYFLGFLFTEIVLNDSELSLRAVIAYPIGISLVALSGLIILISGIRYSLLTVCLMIIFIMLIALIFRLKNKDKSRISLSVKSFIIITLIVIAVSIISASGLVPVSISNDSIYYYSLYPQTIAIDGAYDLSYDVFLTDVGQSIAVINTLPFLLGFHETFGIFIAMMFSFCAFFIYFWRKRLLEVLLEPRMVTSNGIAKYIATHTNTCANIGTVLAAVVLFSTTPFIVMSQWVLANAYFMYFMFMVFALTIMSRKEHNADCTVVIIMFIMMLSMMRMEGGIMVGILVLCLSMLDISNSKLISTYIVPSLILIVPYYIVLYVKFKVDPLYSFLDIKNALLQVAFLFAIGIYFAIIRNKYFLKLQGDRLSFTLIGALGIVNLVLFAYDKNKYIENIVAFVKNIFLGNGWGYFGFIVLLLLILLPHKSKNSVSATFCYCYVLMVIAVLFARNGALRVGTGDSGNRVMLQIVPFVLYTLIDEILENLVKTEIGRDE